MSKISDLDKAIFNYEREHGKKPEKVIVSLGYFNELISERGGRHVVKPSQDLKGLTIWGIPLKQNPDPTEDYKFE